MRKIKVIKLDNNIKRIISLNNPNNNKVNKIIVPVRNTQIKAIKPSPVNYRKPIKTNQVKILKPTPSRIVKTSNNNHKYDEKINNIKDCGVGKILIMLACGPSVNEIDITKLLNHDLIHIMVINKPIPSINPEYWAFCDNSQYTKNKDVFNSYGKLTITSSSVRASKINHIMIKPIHSEGIKRDLKEGYVIGRSSVYANIQVALWMNYDKIFIFGIDMCEVNGKLHHSHYGINTDVSHDVRIKRFNDEEYHYNIMSEKMPEDLRKKIYFCSSYNTRKFVDKFNRLDHKVAVEEIIKNI